MVRREWFRALAALSIGLAGGAFAAPAKRRNEWLAPGFGFNGARLIRRMDAGGNAMPQDIGPWMPLTFPVAVAPTQLDVYVADAGSGQLLRYDRALDAIAVMPGLRVTPTTRIRAGVDGSVYVLESGIGAIRRYTRGGQQLPSMLPQRAGIPYVDFAIDQLTGKAYAVDSAYSTIDEIQPLGKIAIEFQKVDEPGPIASDGRSLYIAGSRCGCVSQYLNGRLVRRFGAGKLRLPRALVHAGGLLWALDAAQPGVLMVHEEGVEVQPAASLGLLQPEGIAGAAGQLWIADAAGRRVASFQVDARRSRPA